jgi:hypothetical protein
MRLFNALKTKDKNSRKAGTALAKNILSVRCCEIGHFYEPPKEAVG